MGLIRDFVNYTGPSQVLVIQNGTKKTMSAIDAFDLSVKLKLDFVVVSHDAATAVVKIMDYHRFIFEQKKTRKVNQLTAKNAETKILRMKPSIADNDLNTKHKAAIRFLEQGNKVEIQVRMIGRQKAHPDLAKQKLIDFVAMIQTKHKIEYELEPKQLLGKKGFQAVIFSAKK